MANLSCHSYRKYHYETIKATIPHLKAICEESSERPSTHTNLYGILWDTIQKLMESWYDEQVHKRMKIKVDKCGLLQRLQASINSLITSCRHELTISGLKIHGSSPFTDTPKRESPCVTLPVQSERYHEMKGHLQILKQALEICEKIMMLREHDEEGTQPYESKQTENQMHTSPDLSLHGSESCCLISPEKATLALSNFRPSKNTPVTLHALLIAKADPNICLGDGGITPLHNVTAFAKNVHVWEMRHLLFEAGASENNDLRKRWLLRCDATNADAVWLANFHQEPM